MAIHKGARGNQDKIVNVTRSEIDFELGFDVDIGSSDASRMTKYSGDPSAIEKHFLTQSYDRAINIYGRFQQESIALGVSELG